MVIFAIAYDHTKHRLINAILIDKLVDGIHYVQSKFSLYIYIYIYVEHVHHTETQSISIRQVEDFASILYTFGEDLYYIDMLYIPLKPDAYISRRALVRIYINIEIFRCL